MQTKRFAELTIRELHDILRLRSEVFVAEQGCAYADVDGRDAEPGTRHHWIERDGTIVAYARTLEEPGGAIRIGRVVTAATARRSGLAAELIRHLTTGLTGEVVLDAQSHLTGWYERAGYQVSGASFVEDGIPHVPMRRLGSKPSG